MEQIISPRLLALVAGLIGGVALASAGWAQTATISALAPVAGQEARGLVRSSARVEVRTDLSVPVAHAPFGDGQPFKKGDLLIEFDCRQHRAELESVRAAANAAAIELKNKRELHKHGAAGKSEVNLARAEAGRASADVRARLARVAQCSVFAPFSGRVVVLNTRQHETATPSEPVIIVLDDSVLELELVVPSKWLRWLKADAQFDFRVDETGHTHRARIDRLGAEVDPVSQTIKAYGRLIGETNGVLAGMSGRALFAGKGS